jgi:hypothetical protein
MLSVFSFRKAESGKLKAESGKQKVESRKRNQKAKAESGSGKHKWILRKA